MLGVAVQTDMRTNSTMVRKRMGMPRIMCHVGRDNNRRLMSSSNEVLTDVRDHVGGAGVSENKL